MISPRTLPVFVSTVVASMGGGRWFVMLVPASVLASTTEECASLLSVFSGTTVLPRHPNSAEDLASITQEQPEQLLLLSVSDSFSDEEWHHLDLLRSKLAREGNVVLMLSEESYRKLARNAKHLKSWVDEWSFQEKQAELTKKRVERRLRSLRQWSGHDDAWVLQAAKDKTLPTDPEYAEWLVLLERGDLLVH